jgi:N utilization substance protein B
MLTRRSRAREVALQLLYQHDLNPRAARRPDVERFVKDRLRDPAVEPFTLRLYDGVLAHQAEIDRRLSETASNWRLQRMAVVDRNVLRLGSFELLFTPETPPNVAIDEAIELARRYGSANSPAFVNGVLDRLRLTAVSPA